MFKTNTFEILKWDLIITFVRARARGTQVVWLLLLDADRLLFHFGKLETKVTWAHRMKAANGKWMRWLWQMNEWMNEWMEWPSRCAEEKASASRCWMWTLTEDLTSSIWESSVLSLSPRWSVNFLDRFVMTDDLDTIFVIRSCPFDEMQVSGANDKHLAIQMDPFFLDFSSRHVYLPRWTQMKSKATRKKERASDRASFWIRWAIVTVGIGMSLPYPLSRGDRAENKTSNTRELVWQTRVREQYTQISSTIHLRKRWWSRKCSLAPKEKKKKKKAKMTRKAVQRSVCLTDDHVRMCVMWGKRESSRLSTHTHTLLHDWWSRVPVSFSLDLMIN